MNAVAPLAGNPAALAALVGIGIIVFFLGIYVTLKPSSIEQRLTHFVGQHQLVSGTILARGRTSDFLEAFDRGLARRRQAQSTRLLLQRANASMTVTEFILLRLVSALISGGIIALVLGHRLGPLGLVLAAAGALLGSFVPVIVVQIRARRRHDALVARLPDALDLIGAALQSGAGLAQSYGLIAREMQPPISEEFQRVLREVEVGLSAEEALDNLATRVGSEDLDLVVTTINVQSRVGGNLVEILRTINDTIRDRIRIRGEIQVLTAMQRLSAYVIAAVPPGLGLFIYLINPRYIGRLFQPGIGEMMLIASTIMAVSGFLVLRRITTIDI